MKIASYNLNNLFERPRVFELDGLSEKGALVLKDYYRLAQLLQKESYTRDEAEIREIIQTRIETKSSEKYFEIIQVKEKLYTKVNGSIKLKAVGKNDWLGWVELIKTEVNEVATQQTARVVDSLQADILCTIEVESRMAMENFNQSLLKNKYKYTMLIDGNDERGIDVGLYSNYPIIDIETHIYDTYTGANGRLYRVFSRDCAIYTIDYQGKPVHILCNHFKSQGYGSPASNNRKREVQAQRVHDILLQKYDLRNDYVIVAGDLNDVPQSASLKPLLNMHNLENIITRNGPQGTYLNTRKQFDYLLVSQALAERYTNSGVDRSGIYSRKGAITNLTHQASDHAAVWAEFEL
jgi:endonuclease/exonuclease/phosphatase family metal-dependent hydrolase